jgi:hypothetical protein
MRWRRPLLLAAALLAAGAGRHLARPAAGDTAAAGRARGQCAARPAAAPAARAALLGAAALAAAYPLLIRLMLDSATPALLQHPPHSGSACSSPRCWRSASRTSRCRAWPGPSPGWLGRRCARCSLRPRCSPRRAARRHRRAGAGAAGRAAAAAAGRALGAAVRAGGPALAPLSGRGGSLARWLCASWLAGTAVLPHVWHEQLEARLAAAEAELETLGTQADPFLDYLLLAFAGRPAAGSPAARRACSCSTGHGWPAAWPRSRTPRASCSGRRTASRPCSWAPRRCCWRRGGAAHRAGGGRPAEERVSLVMQFTDLPNVSKLLTVPLGDGSLITVVVPPRRSLDRTGRRAVPGRGRESPVRLTLVEATGPPAWDPRTEWVPRAGGLARRRRRAVPRRLVQRNLVVPVPASACALVRGALLLAFNLAAADAALAGRPAGAGRPAVPRGAWRRLVRQLPRPRHAGVVRASSWCPRPSSAGRRTMRWPARSRARRSASRSTRCTRRSWSSPTRPATCAAGPACRHRRAALPRRRADRRLVPRGAGPGRVFGVAAAAHLPAAAGGRRSARPWRCRRWAHHSFVTAYRTLPPTGTLGVPMSLSAGETPAPARAGTPRPVRCRHGCAALAGAVRGRGSRAGRPIGQLRRASAPWAPAACGHACRSGPATSSASCSPRSTG